VGERVERPGRGVVAGWLGLPEAALADVSEEVVEAMLARMAAQPPPASVLRDELLELMRGAADRLRHEAETDALTGLPNRRAFERELRGALGRRGADRALALLVIDLDGFKAVNDRHGHVAGDAVLCEVSARLRSALRSGDLVARWGGDEFVVLCHGVRDGAAAEIACKLRRVLQVPVQVGSVEVTVGASLGWAVAEPGQAPGELIAAADAAMYRAKAQELE
jgi:diguanylate cyclase (GGDEF)-like protein